MTRTSIQNVSAIVVRLCYVAVFAINVQCAFAFIIDPASYLGGFQLTGLSGTVAIQGIGIAFLMWNATYPLFILRPARHVALGVIVLVQQLVGFVGETIIWCSLPPGNDALGASIGRFMIFDGIGFVLMAGAFCWFLVTLRQSRSSDARKPTLYD